MEGQAGADSDAFSKHYDTALNTLLRPHQIQALKFLLPRLLGEEAGPSAESDEEDLLPQQRRDSEIPLTGAILADDMGTGKTLTALAVVWCLCRHGKGKGVIVCPSTLVDNWRAEIKKWFPKNLDRNALFINGSNRSSGAKGTDSIIELFATSHPAMRPLLVLSYDMFRIYADILNDVATLNTIVCDEGHKVKNAFGTKTTLALGNSGAMQRLVLTGTPIQNNLNELFAVVQFAAPGYLGDLKEFQSRYADPITKRPSSAAAEKATTRLRAALRRILLRRDRDAILKAVLPPRVVTRVVCRMSGEQREGYLSECAALTAGGRLVDSGCSDIVPEDERSDRTDKKARVGASADAAAVSGSARGEGLLVLSRLLSLRQQCSSPLGEADAREAADLDAHLSKSVKLRVLDAMLTELRRTKPTERVVIVSNFISTLDTIHLLARKRRHLTLRLDGDVAADKRQNIVNHFNNPKEPFFLMLLSAKAGGVGLNLIGATRLVLWEPDWNPSTDEQAMGRIWRDGQTRNVFIYRLIADNSIEETILERQSMKNDLHSVIREEHEGSGEVQNREVQSDAMRGKRERGGEEDPSTAVAGSVSLSALGSMILPRGNAAAEVQPVCHDSPSSVVCSGDDVLDSVIAVVGSDVCYTKDMST